jgi:hypothetical protein
LPEDIGEVLSFVCSILHFHAEGTPTELSVDTLADVATLANGYDMSRALEPWSSRWLEQAGESAPRESLTVMMRIAYLLDDVRAFSDISWKIMCDQVGPFQNVAEKGDVGLIHSGTGISRYSVQKAFPLF